MTAIDFAFGIGVVCWAGSLAQFAIVMFSSARRTWKQQE